jgi:hypothetical protein
MVGSPVPDPPVIHQLDSIGPTVLLALMDSADIAVRAAERRTPSCDYFETLSQGALFRMGNLAVQCIPKISAAKNFGAFTYFKNVSFGRPHILRRKVETPFDGSLCELGLSIVFSITIRAR